MKKLNQLFALACTVLMSVSFVACSSDDNSDAPVGNKPAVTLVAGTAGQNVVTFTVSPENAEKCAWVCLAPGEAVPSAEEILANELNAVSATEPSFVEVSGLSAETEYTIVAAVSSGTTAAVSAPLKMKTLDVNNLVVAGTPQAQVIGGFGATREADIIFRVGGDDQVVIPVLYDSNLKYLPAGTYTVGSEDEPGIIDNSNSDYCHFYYGGEVYALTDGTMTIELENDEYDIDFQFTTAAGEFKLTYKGEIDGIQLYSDLSVLSEGARFKGEVEVDGEYWIRLTNPDGRQQELVLNFYADASSKTLPAGTYTVGTGTNPGTLGAGTAYISRTPQLTTDEMTSGTVVVSQDGDDYTFVMQLYNEEGYAYKGTFTGTIAYMERNDDDVTDRTVIYFTTLKKGSGTYYPGNFSANPNNHPFSMTTPQMNILNCDAFVQAGDGPMPAGTYTVGEGESAWTIQKGKWTYMYNKIDGKNTKEEISEGTLTVTIDGDTYKFVMDVTVNSGKYRCIYEGEYPMEW
ncbi:MAG: hypothetical protein K2H74_06005 [Paramuribaculum sp.]|nr:hypothetical protein [Paramuribaculum sp.]